MEESLKFLFQTFRALRSKRNGCIYYTDSTRSKILKIKQAEKPEIILNKVPISDIEYIIFCANNSPLLIDALRQERRDFALKERVYWEDHFKFKYAADKYKLEEDYQEKFADIPRQRSLLKKLSKSLGVEIDNTVRCFYGDATCESKLKNIKVGIERIKNHYQSMTKFKE